MSSNFKLIYGTHFSIRLHVLYNLFSTVGIIAKFPQRSQQHLNKHMHISRAKYFTSLIGFLFIVVTDSLLKVIKREYLTEHTFLCTVACSCIIRIKCTCASEQYENSIEKKSDQEPNPLFSSKKPEELTTVPPCSLCSITYWNYVAWSNVSQLHQWQSDCRTRFWCKCHKTLIHYVSTFQSVV